MVVGEPFFLSLIKGEDNLLHVRRHPSARTCSDTHKVIKQILAHAGGIDHSIDLQSIKVFFWADARPKQNSR